MKNSFCNVAGISPLLPPPIFLILFLDFALMISMVSNVGNSPFISHEAIPVKALHNLSLFNAFDMSIAVFCFVEKVLVEACGWWLGFGLVNSRQV